MRAPTLKDLPAPPQGKTGWPWTEQSDQLPDRMTDGSPWPRISIVTPSLNQGRFIEETIRSVLLQGYPDLEYIIIDGGSSDQSVDIIGKYEKWLTFWLSEPDSGQSQAINKGFRRSTGSIVAWLNSDDRYRPNSFAQVSRFFPAQGDIHFLYGNIREIDEGGEVISEIVSRPVDLRKEIRLTFIPQPACFWHRSLFDQIGYLSEAYHYIFDVEYWLRASLHVNLTHINSFLADFRIHGSSKTQNLPYRTSFEGLGMFQRFFSDPGLPYYIRKYKKYELRHWLERLAFDYFHLGAYSHARSSFIKAVATQPWRVQNAKLLCFILDTILGTDLGYRVVTFRRHFRNRHSL